MGNFRSKAAFWVVLVAYWAAPSWAASVDLTPPFALWQRAPQLSDLWNKKGASNSSSLCAPTATSNALLYLKKYRPKPFPELKMPVDQNGGGRTSTYDFLRYMVDMCNTGTTNRRSGTSPADSHLCVQTYFLHSRFENPLIASMGFDAWPVESQDLPSRIQNRAIELNDIKSALDLKLPVIATLAWFDKGKKGWRVVGGHVVTIYGYKTDSRWGGEKMLLKVTDPWERYPNKEGTYSDLVELTSLSAQERKEFPKTVRWEFRGKHYRNNATERSILSLITIASPVSIYKLKH